MNINELKGSMTTDDFVVNLTSHAGCKTLGEVWEQCVTCNHCSYREQCQAISDKLLEDYDVNTYCNQVIDYLLGDKTLEDIIKEG